MKQSKDKATIYMIRNLFGTFLAAFLSFSISLFMYYQCSFLEIIQRIFIYDIFTTLYLLMLWLLDYLIFELSKVLYDYYEKQVTYIPCLLLIFVGVCIFFVPILDWFQYNTCFMCILMIARMLKQMWKHQPELFSFIKKDQNDGLE